MPLKHRLSRPIDYHVICDPTLNIGHVDHLFDILKGVVLDDN